MGFFKGIKGAKASQGGVYFEPGVYVVEINRCKATESRKGVPLFIVETLIEAASDEAVKNGRNPGMESSWVVALDKDAALGNINSFLALASWIFGVEKRCLEQLACKPGMKMTGPDAVDIDESDAEEACGENQPLAGIRIGLSATEITTRNGNPFTKHTWIPVEQALAQIKMSRGNVQAPF